MHSIFAFVLGALQITLLDLTLCGDNIGVIALATKNLPSQYARKASALGIACAIALIITFASFMTLILSIQWLPIKLVGGLLLVKITWDFIKPSDGEEGEANIKMASRFWEAVGIIIIADISMSLDNVLAIAGAANGHIGLIIFGVSLNIPILFLGSQFIAELMKKYAIAVYIGGAILARTAFKMILEDPMVEKYVPHMFGQIFPWVMGLAALTFGIYIISRQRKSEEAIEAIAEAAITEKDKE